MNAQDRLGVSDDPGEGRWSAHRHSCPCHPQPQTQSAARCPSLRRPSSSSVRWSPVRWSSEYFIIPILLQFLLTYAQGQGHGSDLEEGLLPTVNERVNFEVEEERPRGTYVGSIPTLEGLTYRFSEESRWFNLDANTGGIKTKVVIDRETLPNDVFDLFVQSLPAARHLIEVKITVLDINDNSPVFGQPSIEITYSERDQPGTLAILDTASDADVGDNDVTRGYELVAGDGGGRFRLVLLQDTAIPLLYLETTAELDREERETYQLRVRVPDGGSPPRYGFLTVNVTVKDFNDNSPVFDQSYYSVQMNETSPPGTEVIRVQATDRDIGPNGDIRYSVSADAQGQFAIDSLTGVLTTTRLLQCQQSCTGQTPSCNPNSCHVTVQGEDQGGLSGRAYITVSLMDENDHDPAVTFRYFTSLPWATVDESAQEDDIVAFVSVVDQDTLVNGKTIVRITKGNDLGHFRLLSNDRSSNLLSVVGPIDREQVSQYNLTFEAHDLGTPPRKSSAFLVIKVNDINDHAPVFQRPSYHTWLSELAPIGSFVASITASDNDTGLNAELTYSIIAGNDLDLFTINQQTGLVTTRTNLDRETTDKVILKIQAADSATDPFQVVTNLTVDIWDENDETPHFSHDEYLTGLREGSPASTEVITVVTQDNDEGKNGTVVYSLTPDTESAYPGLLFLNQVSGQISLARELDREEYPEIVILIQAADRGEPSLSSTATVKLYPLDLNDNAPVFYPTEYYATIGENLPAFTSVAQVTATDPDNGVNGTVFYSIRTGASGKFAINIRSGVISTQEALDREEQGLYRLEISARDGLDRFAEDVAVVEVSVSDVQDTVPEFSQDFYVFSIVEDDGRLPATNLGRSVNVVKATTADESGVIRYAITGGDPEKIFAIDAQSGEITAAKPLDREHRSLYQLTVTAVGGAKFAEVRVNISILDVNDNIPSFQQSQVEAFVVENWPVGHSVYVAAADDQDDGNNGAIKYSLLPRSSAMFEINPDTAMITLAESLQYATDTSFDVTVKASDRGVPSLSSQQSVHITVVDVNDHTPTFEKSSYEISVNESQAINDRFFRVIAADADFGRNGEISYSIIKGNDDNLFGMFPDGVLYIRGVLDREVKDLYILTVEAIDRGVEPRMSQVNVTIRVLDANDNSPIFVDETFNFFVEEGTEAGSSVGFVRAVDSDVGLNGEISYKLVGEPKGFDIDPQTGLVTSLAMFDREAILKASGQEQIVITVAARDSGSPSLETKTDVHIFITDINDNAPMFQQPVYEAKLRENERPATPIIKISASDQDSGTNSEIVYSILDGNLNDVFSLDPSQGQLGLAAGLDREQVDEYLLIVMAMDSGYPPLNATCRIKVTVEDANDNKPALVAPKSVVRVLETADVGEYVTQVQAKDVDFGSNAFLSYKISSGNTNTAFRIDANNGRIYVAGLLDYEQNNIYRLNITVHDSGEPVLSDSIIVPVYILDYNDNPPAFTTSPFLRSIQEGAQVGTVVVKVTALDPDQGNNGRISYSIKAQQPLGEHFEIDSLTGNIRTSAEIDREFAEEFQLTVLAVDQAEPKSTRKSSEKQVTILVEDVNDNAPEFVSMSAVAVMIGTTPDTKIMTVRADDKDAGQNAEVTYEIVSGQTNLFRIDSLTGDLYLKTFLNNQVLTYDLTLRATDRGSSDRLGEKSSTMQLTVFTISTTDAGPRYPQSSYSSDLLENAPAGTSVVAVRASYPARPTADLVYYVTRIRSGEQDAPRYFTVNPTTGVVSNSAPLDRDGPHSAGVYDVQVYAVDRSSGTPQTRATNVRVTLVDTNDSPPVFDAAAYSFEVSEDVAVGYEVGTLTAQDADTEGKTEYSIVDGAGGKFGINPRTGALRVTSPLNRESVPQYKVKVAASDSVQNSVVTVTVTVSDVNDSPPVFLQEYYYLDVPEDTPTSTVIGQVVAVDTDAGQNAALTYSIASYWGREKFSVHHATGVLTLAATLDYEEVPHYIVTVKAQDGGAPSLSGTATVVVNIVDVNDHAPVFDHSSYSVSVLENVTMGTSVLQLSVTDMDSGDNARVTYSITSGDDLGHFSVDPLEGVLYTQRPLDCETTPLYFLEIRATDRATHEDDRLYGTTLVTVLLQDVNDNPPVFTSPGTITVSEAFPPDTPVGVVTATDADQGANSYVEYSVGPGPLSVDRQDGTLRTTTALDRETLDRYVVTVTARDQGDPALSATLSLTVVVGDYNDHSPAFSPRAYSVTVSEALSVGASLLTVTASDQDTGVNAEVIYTVTAGDATQDFFLDAHSGDLLLQRPLDRERRHRYDLTVTAQDRGEISRSDVATVTITVTDVNDCAPVFTDSPYIQKVQENVQSLPVHVVMVTATDADAAPNNQVYYSLSSEDEGATVFTINATTGIITAHERLDREERDRYLLTVTAVDSGSPRLTGTGTVTVIVDDDNDNSPEFVYSAYRGRVPEGGVPGAEVVRVYATDRDTIHNGDVSYSLLSTEGDRFTIDPATGQISTVIALDREEQAEYSLVAVATDGGSIPRSSTVTLAISVLDVNDEHPQFVGAPYTAYIRDPTPKDTFVFGVLALDCDAGDNGRLQYTFPPGTTSDLAIDGATGVVTARNMLTSGGAPQGYTTDVMVTDKGQNPRLSQETLTISFLSAPTADFPVITSPTQTQLDLSETTSPDVVIATVAAFTSRPGAELSYHIAGGNTKSAFVVHATSGEVSVASGLDYEEVTGYDLWLEARDDGSPPLSDYTKLRIDVVDENDNTPTFDLLYFNTSVPEESGGIPNILKVTASDPDSGENGRVSYAIAAGNDDNHFSIDGSTGDLRTVDSLDRETQDLYHLIIVASDHGAPSHSATATVAITVLDINDNMPQFSKLFSASVPETVPVGFSVLKITSLDADIHPNNVHMYTVLTNQDKFSVNSVTGDLTVAETLDRETRHIYTVQVSVSDGQNGITTHVTIDVLDANDNPPAFMDTAYTFEVVEGRPAGTSVGAVTATDPDAPGSPNSALYYRLQDSSRDFRIDAETGEISTRRPLTYTDNPQPTLRRTQNTASVRVRAIDLGDTPLHAEVTVTVHITPANQHAPQFDQLKYTAPAAEDSVIGLQLIQLNASDADFGKNAEVAYSITGGSGSQYVVLHSESGWLSVSRSLSGLAGSDFSIEVKVEDQGTPPKSGLAEVILKVTQVNNYAPVFDPNMEFSVTLPEDKAVGSIIAQLSATDEDSGANGLVSYFITGGDPQGQFSLDESRGNLAVAGALDYENVTTHHLDVSARDRGLIPRETSQVFTVALTDVNDSPPVFPEEMYLASVEENTASGTLVTTVTATDADMPPHATVSYALEGSSQTLARFSIDAATGRVRSQGALDYESQQRYAATVRARNPGTPLAATALLHIDVTGANEYTPVFSTLDYEFVVSESDLAGSYVGTVTATDRDMGRDGEVWYYLVGDSNMAGFSLDALSGELTVASHVDRESTQEVVLHILAKNAGPIHGNDTAAGRIRVVVRDANDAPSFVPAVYDARVVENAAPGASVVTVTAVDSDVLPANHKFSYTMLEGGDLFSVGAESGEIRTKGALDRESLDMHILVVGAIDMGSPPKTGSATVSVTVEDVNDNGPNFDPEIPTGSILEEQDPYTAVAIVLSNHTRDPDNDPNRSPYTYTLLSHTAMFDIATATGQVKAKLRLDRELNDEYMIRVEVTDGGSPSMTSTLTFEVKVQDINDNPSSPRPLSVAAFAYDGVFPEGAVVADIKPLDPDTTGDYSCSLIGGDTSVFTVASACELSAGATQAGRRYEVEVTGGDGVHGDVEYSVSVDMATFTAATIDNSIVIRLSGQTPGEFLDQSYSSFLDAVTSAMSQGEMAVLFGLHDDREVLSVLVSVSGASGGYVGPALVALRVTQSQAAIEAASGVTIAAVNDSPCAGVECDNGGECRYDTALVPGAWTRLLGALVAMTAPSVRQEAACACPPGYEGETCDVAVDACRDVVCHNGGSCQARGGPGEYSCLCTPSWTGRHCQQDVNECVTMAPCLNNATCHNTAGSYECQCGGEYSGRHCELTGDPCDPRPCLHGATCVTHGDGYTCLCRHGDRGQRCEVSARGYGPLSYEEYPGTLQPDANTVTVEMALTAADALLIFYPAAATDFLALEVVSGNVRLSWRLGDEPVTRVTVPVEVSDGEWWRVEAKRNGKVGSLRVSPCRRDQPECDVCQTGDESCHREATGQTYEILDTSPGSDVLYVGGVSALATLEPASGRVSTHDLHGSLRALTVDTVPVFQQPPSASDGVTDHVTRPPQGVCELNAGTAVCENEGECTDEWDQYRCTCPEGFTGERCQEEVESFSFASGATVTFTQKESYRRDQIMDGAGARRRRRALGNHVITMTIITKEKEGVLLHSKGGDAYGQIYLSDGRVSYGTRSGESELAAVTVDLDVSDARQHNVTLAATAGVVTLTVDAASAVLTPVTYDPLGLALTALSLGGVPKELAAPGAEDLALVACVDAVTLDGRRLPLAGTATDRFLLETRGSVGLTCPLAPQKPPVHVAVIVVVVFFVVALLVILAVFLVLRRRKQRAKSAAAPPAQPAKVKDTAAAPDKTTDSGGQDSGFGEILSEEAIIRQHVAHEMTRRRLGGEGSRPDVVAPDVARSSQPRSGPGVFNEGYAEEEPPEHYDIDNASSIAPSDLVDVVSHYRKYRSGLLGHGAPARPLPPGRPRPLPGLMLGTSRTASPMDLPATPAGRPDTSSLASSSASQPRPTSRSRQPITAAPRGLTVEEIQRLNTHGADSPSLAPGCRDDESWGPEPAAPGPPRDHINRTDFTHADLSLPAGRPSSDDDDDGATAANDSFTCSEFESDNDRLRQDFSDPRRLMLGPRGTARGPPAPSPAPPRSDSSHPDHSFSTLFSSEDGDGRRSAAAPLNLDCLLNWGPNFEKLVGVFTDIAELPDAASKAAGPRASSPRDTSPAPPLPVIVEDTGYHRRHGYRESPHSRVQSPHSRVQSPHSRVQSPHSRVQSPHERLESPHDRLQSPYNGLQSPHDRLQSPHSGPHSRNQSPHDGLQSPHDMYQPHHRVKSPHINLHSPHNNIHAPHKSLHSPHNHLNSPHNHLNSPHNHLNSPHDHLNSPHNHLNSPHNHLNSPHNHLNSPHSSLHSPHDSLPSPHNSLPSPHNGPQPTHQPAQSPYGGYDSPHDDQRTHNGYDMTPNYDSNEAVFDNRVAEEYV